MYKLGRRAVRHDPKRLLVGHEVMEALPTPPDSVDNTNGVVSWGLMGNDQLGDCTIAGAGHSLQVATLNTGTEFTAPDSVILAGYEKYCGYVPGDPATDRGGIEADVLDGFEKDGLCGYPLLATVSIDPKNIDHVKKAIAYFRSIYIGANLPLSAQTQKDIWTVVQGTEGAPGLWGGHCMVSPQYDASSINWITWGENQPADWGWFSKYVDEVHVLLWKVLLKQFPASTQQTVMNMLTSLS